MTLVATRALVADAVAGRRAIVAVNVITLEHAEAVVAGAERAGRDVIVQLSENAVRFHGGRFRPILAGVADLAAAAGVSVALHLDHVEDEALATAAIREGPALGLGSIMVDASRLPFAENVATTARLTAAAQGAGLWVEAELGAVGGKDGAHAPGVRTDPDEATAFVAATGVDGLAVAVGSSHAMAERTAELDVALIGRLAAVPVPLVLHGSSGVPDDALRAAVAAGIRKVNVGTALNVAGTAALRAELTAHPEAVDPRRALGASRDAMTEVVARLLTALA